MKNTTMRLILCLSISFILASCAHFAKYQEEQRKQREQHEIKIAAKNALNTINLQ